MRQKKLIQQIISAVNLGTVDEPFQSKNFPFLSKSPSFISKHAVGNGQYTEYFVRVTRGLYKLKTEPFEKGDFIRLKNISKYKIERFKGTEVNVFEIKNILGDSIEVMECKEVIPISDIQPILINGIDDKNIYYDPIIAASYVMPGDPVLIRNKNYSYYLDAFQNSFMDGANFQSIIKERKCIYVHEVQRFLKEIHQPTGLEIDTY